MNLSEQANRRSANCWSRLLAQMFFFLLPFLSPAQSYTIDAVSREISVFNFGGSSASVEAISREVSIFNRGFYTVDVTSREVSVFDYGFNRLNLTVGSTVVVAGNTGGVPVTVSTIAAVTNVQVAVDFPQNLLSNWSVQAQPPFAASAFVSNSSRLYLNFSPPAGQTIVNTSQLGQISFVSANNQPSAFLPLPVAGAAAPMRDGAIYTPFVTTVDGEVVVLKIYSLLRLSRGPDGLAHLTLYGYSGTPYTIESTTNLHSPVLWQPAYLLTPSDYIAVAPALATTNPAVFFRARE